jgi:hypothetical protein
VPRDGERPYGSHADGVAIGRRLGDGVDADRQRAARAVIHDYRLAEALPKRWRDEARDIVSRASRRLRHDEADRPLRIPIGLCGRAGGMRQYSARNDETK